jgi:hypothetical protein
MKVVPNTLIYLQKFHIFLWCLGIFLDFLSTSELNRNSFWKHIKSFCLTGWAHEPDPHRQFNRDPHQHDPTHQPPCLCVTPVCQGISSPNPLLARALATGKPPLCALSLRPQHLSPLLQWQHRSCACHPDCLVPLRYRAVTSHCCTPASTLRPLRCHNVVDSRSTPRPSAAHLAAPTGVAVEQSSD